MPAVAFSSWRDALVALAELHKSASKPNPFAAGEGRLTQRDLLTSPGKVARFAGRISDPANTAPQSVRGSERGGQVARDHRQSPTRPPQPSTSDGQGIARPGRR